MVNLYWVFHGDGRTLQIMVNFNTLLSQASCVIGTYMYFCLHLVINLLLFDQSFSVCSSEFVSL